MSGRLRTDWPVGTRLVGDEGYGPTTIRITYVSDQTILAVNEGDGIESSWDLTCREWSEIWPLPGTLEYDERIRSLRERALTPVELL